MARLTRVYQKIFASNAANNGVFGSLQAGNPTTSSDVATLQSLSAFENGWDDAIEQGDKLPPLEEFQGIQYGISYQQAYIFQEGLPEWDASTTYFKGSLVKTISGTSFKLYSSLADNNVGNVVSDTDYWKLVMDSDGLYAIQTANNNFTGDNTFSGSNTFSGPVSFTNAITKVNITEFGMPDYSAVVSMPSGSQTSSSNGFIIFAFPGRAVGYFTIGDYSQSFDYNYNYTQPSWCCFPIKKGQTWDSGGVYVTFVPCIGG